MTKISILAVLADRDLELDLSRKNRTKHFNPRGPCGPRQRAFGGRRPQVIFQSSRSLRTATRASSGRNGDHQYFNPRGPCGPQLLNLRPKEVPPNISILAVLADRDGLFRHVLRLMSRFQSSRSLRTATCAPLPGLCAYHISILAVLADRDCNYLPIGADITYISILAVLADRDAGDPDTVRRPHISILAVLADRDPAAGCLAAKSRHFNPRGPCGPRLGPRAAGVTIKEISILAVLADRDPPPHG